MIYKEW